MKIGHLHYLVGTKQYLSELSTETCMCLKRNKTCSWNTTKATSDRSLESQQTQNVPVCIHRGRREIWYSSHSDKAALECGREHSSCTGLKPPRFAHNFPWNPGTQKEGSLDSARRGAKRQDMIIQTSRPESQFHDLLTCVTLGKSPTLPKSQFPHQWNGTPHHKDEGNNSSKSKHYAKCLAQNKNSMKIYHHPHSHHYPN